jgi:hypothetical protein
MIALATGKLTSFAKNCLLMRTLRRKFYSNVPKLRLMLKELSSLTFV